MAKTRNPHLAVMTGLIVVGLCWQAVPSCAASLGRNLEWQRVRQTEFGQARTGALPRPIHEAIDKIYVVSARCASASTSLNQTGELLKVRSNLFVGDFYNPQFDVRGRIRVVISGNTQRVTLKSDRATGSLRLKKR